MRPEEEPVPAEAQGRRETVRLLPTEVSQAVPLGQQPQRGLREQIRDLSVMISPEIPHSDCHVLRLTNDHTYSVKLSARAMMITIIFTGPACSLSAPVGAAIHI